MRIPFSPRVLSEGAIWGPKWVWFWHAPRAWSPWQAVFKLSVGSPACKLFTAPELENCLSGRPCLMGRSVNPTFHSQMSTPDQPLQQITWFLVFWCSCDKWTSLQNNWIESTQWLVRCAFWVDVISLEKTAKGVPKWVKIRPPSNLSFNIQYQFAT